MKVGDLVNGIDVPWVGTLMRTRAPRLFYENDDFLNLLSMPIDTSFIVLDLVASERIASLGVFRMIKMLLDDGRVGYVPLHDLRHFEKISGPP